MLPSGPKGSWLPTLRLIRNPRKMLETWRTEFGDPFLMRALNGPLVITGKEEWIREIFGTDPSKFDQFAVQTILPVLGSGSIFAMIGDSHRRERKLLMPMFHGDRMRSYGNDMCDQALRCAHQHLEKGSVETLEMMTDISFGVIVKSIIGGTEAKELSDLIAASKLFVDSVNPILLFTRRSHFSFLGISPWDRFIKAKAQLVELIDRIIDRHLTKLDRHDDILSMLCQATYEDGQPMTRDHIRDELLTFLFAGHETTALTLTWAMYHLHRHPLVLHRLREELDPLELDPAELNKASYLKACIQETLRIHPIVTEVVRKLREPLELGPYTVPAGYGVAPATVLAHYNPDVYPEPDRFHPERFLDRSYSPFCYLPFGGGHRRCVGAAFATYELAIVLGTLLKKFSFELLSQQEVVPVRRNITMAPSSSVPMKITARAI